MTDITELAQSLKAAAEKATQGNWRAFKYHDGRCGIGGGHHDEIMVCEHISKRRPHDAEFIALANPANILALVEALEKAQQVDEELCKLLPPGAEYMDPPDGGDVTPLEGVRRMVADYRQRIAELREWNAGLAQESFERQQRISELLEGKLGNALLERENHHVEVVGKLAERIAELESRTVKLPELCVGVVQDGHAVMVPYPAGNWFNKTAILEMLADAGIKVDAE